MSRQVVARVLRVDQAGEYGARRIYEGQLAVLERFGKDEGAVEAVRQMYQQELVHLHTMDSLITSRRVRPTLLAPLWHVGGWFLGAATAALGPHAAMACTVAVETEIGRHYNDQLRELHAVAPHEKELLQTIAQFRDDELHHKETALQEGAAKTPGYELLVNVVSGITRAAIKVAERV